MGFEHVIRNSHHATISALLFDKPIEILEFFHPLNLQLCSIQW